MAGKFITFEGGEGAGKSTQIRRLADRLAARGVKVVATREPGGSPAAEAIRKFVLSGAARPLGAEGEAMLFAAARADHVETLIRPALAAGTWVLSDRFIDSTRAYQGAGGGVSGALLDALEAAAVGDTRPDLTLILDLPAEAGLARLRSRLAEAGESADRFESEALAAHELRRRAFLDIARREPGRVVVVDATGDPATVGERVYAAVASRLLKAAA